MTSIRFRRLIGTAVASLLLGSLAAPAALADAVPGGLAGMWSYDYGDGTVQHLLLAGGTARIFVTGNDQAVGGVSVTGSTITFGPTNRCDGSGTYQWTVTGGVLTFTPIATDPCRRGALLPSVPWTRP